MKNNTIPITIGKKKKTIPIRRPTINAYNIMRPVRCGWKPIEIDQV
jgi:hypothetical protein